MKILLLIFVVILIISTPKVSPLLHHHQDKNPRRILHQPLFPDSAPPPADDPPPPPAGADTSTPDQPFFPEVPAGETPDQNQSPPPPPPAAGANSTIPIAAAAQQTKPAEKVAIAISVGIVTLGMLSALVFFLYRHRVKHQSETQKLVLGGDSERQRQDDSRVVPSFLYIGTVEPSRISIGDNNGANGSPYRKLNSDRSHRSESMYRPSPELQPLPPLVKPFPVENSSPASVMSSSLSDEESRDTEFHTPQCSSMSNEDGYYTPRVVNSVPYLKRTSPRSRFYAASPEMKHVIIPSIKKEPPVVAAPVSQQLRVQGDPKFSAPPPRPNMEILRSLTNPAQKSKIPTPPPPPPPPRPPPPPPAAAALFTITPNKVKPLETSSSSMPAIPLMIKPQISTPSTKSSSGSMMAKSSSSDRTDGDEVDGGKPRLKPLHWDKVRATSDRATVWDQLKSSSFQLNEDMMESLFGCNSTNPVPKEPIRKSVLPPVEQENRVLDPKKSQNIAILLRALNVTRDEVSEALLDGNPGSLGADLLETLVKMAPTKEEEIKLRDYKGNISKLGSAERFLKTILDIPFVFKRVEAMLYRANFDSEVQYLRKSFHTLEVASEELKNSRLFHKLLEAVLQTGNRMNVGTNRGGARAFKLDSLLKLVDIKGTDGKTTVLHFVVQEIIRSEGLGNDSTNDNLLKNMKYGMKEDEFRKQGLHVVAGLCKDLSNVKKAAGMDSDVLSSYVTKLEMGLEKVRVVLQYEKQGKFFSSINTFLREAEEEIAGIKAYERTAILLVKEVTEYFHGDSTKEEAHPLRIFMIVRDFLSTLDHVCKEVGKMQDKTMVGSARNFRIPASASLPVLNRYHVRQDSSDEDSSSP